MSSTTRSIAITHAAPGLHWVGDGFRVRGHFAPQRDLARELDPFLLLDHHPPHVYPANDGAPRGVGEHPHRGFETVTLAFEGSVEHRDSAGGGGIIGPGDVQWMTAASGLLHEERHAPAFSREGGTFHMAQLWVNLPRAHKMDPPRYQALGAESMGLITLPDGAGTVRVVAGEVDGVVGPARTFSPVRVLDVHLRAGGRVVLPAPARENAGLLVMKGAVTVGGDGVGTDELAVLAHDGDTLALEAREDAHVLVLGGEPIGEPIVQYGPFVMNTRREIVEAITDLESGAFGRLVG